MGRSQALQRSAQARTPKKLSTSSVDLWQCCSQGTAGVHMLHIRLRGTDMHAAQVPLLGAAAHGRHARWRRRTAGGLPWAAVWAHTHHVGLRRVQPGRLARPRPPPQRSHGIPKRGPLCRTHAYPACQPAQTRRRRALTLCNLGLRKWALYPWTGVSHCSRCHCHEGRLST